MSGVLFVETRPASPQDAESYHRWYDEEHIPQILAVDGFVSARRFTTDDGSFIAIYEIEGDVATAREALGAAFASGRMSPPQGVQMDPPPVQRYFDLRGEFRP